MCVPIYVKVNGEISPEQQKDTNEKVAELVRKYQKQISEHLSNQKKGVTENDNEKNVSG